MYFVLFILFMAFLVWLLLIKLGAHKFLMKFSKNVKKDLYIDEENKVDDK